jgi:hypothetical protein
MEVSHFLDSRPTDGGEIINFARRLLFTPPFWKALGRLQDHSAAGGIRTILKAKDLIGNRMRDVAACSVVPQPTTLPHAPTYEPQQKLN